MDERLLKQYGFKKIVPTLVELRQYLYQCTYFTDKRCYIPISAGIEEFISKKNIDEMNYEQISSILLYFKMLPEFLYYYVKNEENPSNIFDDKFNDYIIVVLDKDKVINLEKELKNV